VTGKRHVPSPLALPLMMSELAAASWETVWHRSLLMMTGQCTIAEYQQMITEKMSALQSASTAMLAGRDAEAVLRPFHKRATANARRLRK
jgi:hypothetical protein